MQELLRDLHLDREPAFQPPLKFEILDLPLFDGILGAYYPRQDTIVLPTWADETTLLHELGHRYSHFWYHDISERAAEDWRKSIQGNSTSFASLMPAIVGGIMGLTIGLS